MNTEIFAETVRKLLGNSDKNEQDNVDKASRLIYESMRSGGVLHVFCAGHSHMIAETFFYRAGCMIRVNSILFPFLIQHEGAVSSTKFERLPGVAKILY